MKYVHRFGTGSYSAFRVTHADFTGEAFSGPPFEGVVSDDGWLQAALQSGMVALMANRGASHAIWHVTTVGAEVILASPGDYIVKPDNDDNLYVCHGPLWEMLTEPAVKDELSLEDKVKEILRAGAEEIRHSTKIDWSAFMGKLDDVIGAVVPNTRSIGKFYQERIVDAKAEVTAKEHKTDVALANVWLDTIRQRVMNSATDNVETNWDYLQVQLVWAQSILGTNLPEDFSSLKAAVDHRVSTDPGMVRGLSAALSTTVIDDDGVRTTYPAGKQDVFDERLFPTVAAARTEEVVPAIYRREQHHQDKANTIINTLRSMLDNDDVGFHAPGAYQDLNWAKYILLDKAPIDLKLITDKCLTLGTVELLPSYGGNEDMTRMLHELNGELLSSGPWVVADLRFPAQGPIGEYLSNYMKNGGLFRFSLRAVTSVDWRQNNLREQRSIHQLITFDLITKEMDDVVLAEIAQREADRRLQNQREADDPSNNPAPE